MAKRKRLTPANADFLSREAPAPRPGPLGSAPIAQVAGEAAATAALAELSAEMQTARDEGRLVEALPLEVIDEGHLVRDRMVQDEDEMEALVASLRSRGQQTPIEVIRLPAPSGGRTHGLISGWRRLTALRRLHAETGEARFATARALVIAPETAEDAYVAMVEENEIRVNLSHYERARIAVKAIEEGVYADARAALQGLYGSVPRSKRSKIGSFMRLVEAFDDVLRFPTAISEKLGLALVKAMEADPGLKNSLCSAVRDASADNAAREMAILSRGLVAPARKAPESSQKQALTACLDPKQGRIEITGEGVDAALFRALEAWLKSR